MATLVLVFLGIMMAIGGLLILVEMSSCIIKGRAIQGSPHAVLEMHAKADAALAAYKERKGE